MIYSPLRGSLSGGGSCIVYREAGLILDAKSVSEQSGRSDLVSCMRGKACSPAALCFIVLQEGKS